MVEKVNFTIPVPPVEGVMLNEVMQFLKTINQQLGYVTAQMETPHWICVSCIVCVIGFLMMRGNTLRAN